MSDVTKYRYTGTYRKFMIFAGVLVCLLIITLPLGVWLIYIGVRGRVEVGPEGLVARHIRTRRIQFADIERFGIMTVAVRGQGILGALIARKIHGGKTAQHLVFKDAKTGKTWTLLLGIYEKKDELRGLIEQRVNAETEMVHQGMLGPKWPEPV